MDRYLNVQQVMEATGLGRSTIYALFHTEGFPITRIGKRILVSETALRDWLSRGGTQPKDDNIAG
ncbi:MAG: helix-turn-helix domain-containing protein [Candidatus Faecivicinus sp.]